MNLKQKISLLAATTISAIAIAGCGSTWSTDDPTYTPAAYYQTIHGVNDCYYVDTPAEVPTLISQGLCPANSVAVLMPISWEEEYYSYYSSPAYYDYYVPTKYRSSYASITVSFSKKYSTQITKMSSKATYKSSNGGTVSGSKVSTKSFGSGTRTTTSKYGSGTRNGGSSSSKTTYKSSSGGSSSKFGSGSRK